MSYNNDLPVGVYMPAEMRAEVKEAAKSRGGLTIIDDSRHVFYKVRNGDWWSLPANQHPYGTEPEPVTDRDVIAKLQSSVRNRMILRTTVATAAACLITAASVIFYGIAQEEKDKQAWDSFNAGNKMPLPATSAGFDIGTYNPATGQYNSGSAIGSGTPGILTNWPDSNSQKTVPPVKDGRDSR